MPIHLPPIAPLTRRRFLHGSALAGAAMTLKPFSPRGRAAEDDTTPVTDRWALLADTHIDADPATRSPQDVCMADNLKQVLAEVIAMRDQLDAVVINGDCAYIEGLRGDYDTLAKLLHPVSEAGLPIHLTLGNHDDRGPFYDAFADHRPDAPPIDDKHIGVIEGRQVDWVMLDSLRFVNMTEGELGQAQLEWLDRRLAAAPDKPVILIGHHYPEKQREDVIPIDPPPPIPGLVDGDAFLDLARRRDQVKAYIYGHSHFWGVQTDDHGLHQVNLPPTAYVFRPELPSGWVLATAHADHMTLELRAVNPQHPRHGEKTDLRWR